MSEIISSATFSSFRNHEGLKILRKALGEDADLHVVGGSIRDLILEKNIGDIDLASSLTPEEVISRLDSAEVRVVPSGLQHQTVIAVPIKDRPGIEITTFRTSGMRPEAGKKYSKSIEEDLSYRDFTINALAYSLDGEKLVDPFDGSSDIQQRIVRAVGDPVERFKEDPIRVLRMIRFSSMSEFFVDDKTFEAAKLFIDDLFNAAIERIRDEFSGILCSDNPEKGLTSLSDIGILSRLIPELQACVGFEQNSFHSKPVYEHSLEVVSKSPNDLISRLAALFHDIGKPCTLSVGSDGERHFYCHESVGAELTFSILTKLKYPKKTVAAVTKLVATHMRPISAGKSGIRRILRDTGEFYKHWRILKEADSSSVRLDNEVLALELKDFDERVESVLSDAASSPYENLAINGNDILALGTTPGRHIGTILRFLADYVLEEPERNQREYLLELAQKELRKLND